MPPPRKDETIFIIRISESKDIIPKSPLASFKGAITEEEALVTGLTLDEIRSRSFYKILQGRRGKGVNK